MLPDKQAILNFFIFKTSTTTTFARAIKKIVNNPVTHGKSYHVLNEHATDKNHLPDAITF